MTSDGVGCHSRDKPPAASAARALAPDKVCRLTRAGAATAAVGTMTAQQDSSLQCPGEALHDDDGAAPRLPQPTGLSPRPQVALYCAEQHAAHRGAQVVARARA